MRQIVLDTETTGLYPEEGHRIVEIGCVEVINRKCTGENYHVYLNPMREIDNDSIKIHGLTNEFLKDKPKFVDQMDQFLEFLKESELIIHNAPFDLGFLNSELQRVKKNHVKLEERHSIIDTLVRARKKHPGQKNNLDALCKRYGIDNRHRELHGALLDSEILADVYLRMTGGQGSLTWSGLTVARSDQWQDKKIQKLPDLRKPLSIIHASALELKKHEEILQSIEKASGIRMWK